MPGPTKQVRRHLNDADLDEALEAAQRNGEARLVRRLCLIKNLHAGDTLTTAADRVGVSQPTASRWTEAWNEQGVDGLQPQFGGGRPPKLTETQLEELLKAVERSRPLTVDHVRRLIKDGFDVSYSRRHVSRLVKEQGIQSAISRPKPSNQQRDSEFEDRFEAALARIEEDDTDA